MSTGKLTELELLFVSLIFVKFLKMRILFDVCKFIENLIINREINEGEYLINLRVKRCYFLH